MILGLILAVMTAAAIFAVIWPLARHASAANSGSDIEVYRDQLNEVERDVAAGLIAKTEAEAARVEISRRLLAAADGAAATRRCRRVATGAAHCGRRPLPWAWIAGTSVRAARGPAERRARSAIGRKPGCPG
jgi:cytochrome c-type biogenesis protein CcmI